MDGADSIPWIRGLCQCKRDYAQIVDRRLAARRCIGSVTSLMYHTKKTTLSLVVVATILSTVVGVMMSSRRARAATQLQLGQVTTPSMVDVVVTISMRVKVNSASASGYTNCQQYNAVPTSVLNVVVGNVCR